MLILTLDILIVHLNWNCDSDADQKLIYIINVLLLSPLVS